MHIKTLLLSFTAVALPLAAQANFGGIWKIDIDMHDGTHQYRYLDLKQQGNTVTGSVVQNFRSREIQPGTVDGNKIHFDLNVWRDVVETYNGELKDGKLDLTMTRNKTPNSHGGVQTAEAVRSSGQGMKPPPPLDLPKLHKVADNGLARTPPMGWNSWNHFAGKVDDKVVREAADALVSSGMKDAGYIYVNIDDTWEDGRDAEGNIKTNNKFPDMKALADYVHSKGLKIGIYSSPGPYTCGGYEGSYGHVNQDAKSYANWGFDYLKYDWCSDRAIYSNNKDIRPVYQEMGEALLHSGRPIVFSLCEYGDDDVWTWGADVGGNLWRTTGDIGDSWQSMEEIGFKQIDIAQYAQPGHWNDPDMLEVGNGGMTNDEYQVHMTLWCLLSAPLLAGNDLEHMSKETLAILTNRDVIAIDQDPTVHHPKRTPLQGKTEVWTRELHDGSTVIALFNREDEPQKLTVSWSQLGFTPPTKARDLWKHEDVNLSGDSYSAVVPKHGVVLLRAKLRA